MERRIDLSRELEVATSLARAAGRQVWRYRRREFDVYDKEDGEPVTEADLASSRLIVAGLREEFPDDDVLSEEEPERSRGADRRWIVDPLDGTRDFIDDTGDFVVMIGLCIGGRPVLGVVHHPPTDQLYRGTREHGLERLSGEDSTGPRLRMASCSDTSALRLVVSRSHYDPWFDGVKARLGITGDHRRGSVGLKVTLLAAGEFDLYLHRRGLKIWDTCAPQALLEAAGGRMTTLGGEELDYTGDSVRLAHGMLATHSTVLDEVVSRLAELVTEEE
jgi:3'(2'), 5'-bisphosphate nucleotidase